MEHRLDPTGVYLYYPDGGRQAIGYYDISQTEKLVLEVRSQIETMKKDEPWFEVSKVSWGPSFKIPVW